MTIHESWPTFHDGIISVATSNVSFRGPPPNVSTTDSTVTYRAFRSSDTYPDASHSGSTYSRSYTLADDGAPPPPTQLTVVCRETPRKVRPGWNTNRAATEVALKEQLPLITTMKKNKYYYLCKGESAGRVTKRSPLDRYIIQHSTGYKNHQYRARLLRVEGMSALMESFERMKLTAARQDWKAGSKNSDNVESVRVIFDALADNQTNSINADVVHDHLLLCTPTGVSEREASDFLTESCDGKTDLTFQDFLTYGEVLRDRIFAYRKFASLTAEEKILCIATRVLPEPLPNSAMKLTQHIMKAAAAQAGGKQWRSALPMRIYEIRFIDSLTIKFDTDEKPYVACTDGDFTTLRMTSHKQNVCCRGDQVGGDTPVRWRTREEPIVLQPTECVKENEIVGTDLPTTTQYVATRERNEEKSPKAKVTATEAKRRLMSRKEPPKSRVMGGHNHSSCPLSRGFLSGTSCGVPIIKLSLLASTSVEYERSSWGDELCAKLKEIYGSK
ncbi:hypothetical protein DPX39_060043100 [Trypanosoma brucei equiperdum]|uniref:Uncharacterized protein n=1 Tax=Trypanosoma brucei equiperdum TaxID=630700 RepID=A0A3L6LCN0_9TRYP|nr:hypothetical protein DPX39_060043100 [Trypanosoma brucei equiperdum]